MPKATRRIIWIAAAFLVVGAMLHLGVISLRSFGNFSPKEVLTELLRGDQQGDTPLNLIIWTLRLPRLLTCLLVGATLGLCGAVLQTLFRNPLAEPYIVGASSGAAIGGALVGTLGISGIAFNIAKPFAGFVTGLLTLVLVFRLARRGGAIETPTLLLAGVVISTMLSSLLSLIVLESGKDQGVVMRWLLGSMSETPWISVGILLASFSVGYFCLYRIARKMNTLSVGEETALSIGIDVHRLRNQVLVIVTAMIAMTVGPVGIIGFVGLVAPHIARALVGVDLRKTIPLASMTGALILLLADAIAKNGPQGTELPVGIVTALLGAPSLLILMRKP